MLLWQKHILDCNNKDFRRDKHVSAGKQAKHHADVCLTVRLMMLLMLLLLMLLLMLVWTLMMLLLTLLLLQAPLRIAVVERGRVGGRDQEWNITYSDLQVRATSGAAVQVV
jgi:uncharacterized membrane protein